MTDNFGRMTSDEAPQKLKDFCFPKHQQQTKNSPKKIAAEATTEPKQKSSWGKALFEGLKKPSIPYKGEDMIGDNGFGTTEHALKSARDVLWAIANMQITENTDKSEVLALCMSMARLELEKCSTAAKASKLAKREEKNHATT